VKEAGKNPSYPNPNTPKTRTIQIVNPFYYYYLISNVLTVILTKLIKASFANVCAKGLQDKI